MQLDVLVAEPWFGGSHRQWAEGWAGASRHRLRLVTLPAVRWKWRLRAGAVRLAARVADAVRSGGRPDVVVVSSMVDAASLVGLARRELAGVPVVLYLHETHLTQPTVGGRNLDEGIALTDWRSMAAADEIWFNSGFHRDDLLGALPELLRRDPARESQTDLLADVVGRCRVVPLGVTVADLVAAPRPPSTGPPVVVFNHRLAHDKDPGAAFAALCDVVATGRELDLVVTGEGLGTAPPETRAALGRLGSRVRHVGPLDVSRYRRQLLASDVVVSTARHEFFGVSVVEAVAAGAVPVLPDRLSYPEIVPRRFHAEVMYSAGGLGDALGRVLDDVDAARHRVEGLREAMVVHDWSRRVDLYDEGLVAVVGRVGERG